MWETENATAICVRPPVSVAPAIKPRDNHSQTMAAAIGSLLSWGALGLPTFMAGDHERAGRYVSRLLYIAARRRWREARTLVSPGICPKCEEESHEAPRRVDDTIRGGALM